MCEYDAEAFSIIVLLHLVFGQDALNELEQSGITGASIVRLYEGGEYKHDIYRFRDFLHKVLPSRS